MYGWRVVDVSCLPEHGQGLNPSLVEGFVPCQGVVSFAYSRDLGPKGVLGLGHTNIIAVLLHFIFGLLCLLSSLLDENSGLFDLFQFLF